MVHLARALSVAVVACCAEPTAPVSEWDSESLVEALVLEHPPSETARLSSRLDRKPDVVVAELTSRASRRVCDLLGPFAGDDRRVRDRFGHTIECDGFQPYGCANGDHLTVGHKARYVLDHWSRTGTLECDGEDLRTTNAD